MDVIAHRGAQRLAVENTIEALRVALLEGADGVEFDVQVCADGEPVVFHDGSLRRLAGEDARIGALTWRELRGLGLRDEHGHKGRIPHLDEAIELMSERSALCNVELKVDDGADPLLLAETVAARLRDVPGSWVVSSFRRDALRRLARCCDDLPLAPLVHEKPDWDYSALAATGERGAQACAAARERLGERWQALHVHGRLIDGPRMARWRGLGLAVRPWVINDPNHWSQCLDLELSGVITDDPTGLRAYVDGRLG